MSTKKVSAILLASTLVLVTACSSNGGTQSTAPAETPAAETPAPEKKGPTSITMLTGVWGQPPVDIEKSAIFNKLEELTNTDLNITVVPVSNYDQNLNLVMAANELPELVHAFNSKAPTLVKAINQGAFYDLSEFDLSQYPNLQQIPELIWNNSKINGKVYGVPSPVGLNAQDFMIRKDWMEKLNLKEPTTLDELKELLIAFREGDPDGNGQKDTFGLVGRGYGLLGAFGVQEPQIEGDMMLLEWMTPGYRDYLVYLNELYAKDVMPKEYFLMKGSDTKDMLTNGIAGAQSAGLHNAGELTVEVQKKDPNASFMPLNPIQGPNGYTGKTQLGYYGMWLIPTSVDKAKVPDILAYLDQTATDEVNNLMNFGIQGVHYDSLEGQKATASDAQIKLKDEEAGQGTIVFVNKYRPYNDVTKNGFAAELEEQLIESIDNHIELSTANPFEILISDTFSSRYNDVFKDLDATIIKVTTGAISLEEWDTFVEQMKANPTVQQMMKEFKAQYDLANPQ
ncbi:extracellular solute-binding protein [Paenibacillus antri]|uniref:Extracellular solute-binding protein n=1 Tax=Paenibacillus antri TaxID=2582848 RepID=A0A5R9G4B8_9BACL|nr:extracellular solute-binding protein [Paenibacillus antri]TLS50611.1 extracellular solute-binding protein [Paenibacillus antri]